MKGRTVVLAYLCLVLVATALVQIQQPLPNGHVLTAEPSEVAKQRVVTTYGKLPLSFEANHGQTDNRVDFLSRGGGYTLFLTPTEAVLALRKPGASSRGRTRHAPPRNAEAEQAPAAPPAVVRMKLVGANATPEVVGLDKLPGRSNYFIGNNPKKWRTNVPHYAKVQYKDVYPGVDLVYYGNQRQLEYDLVVEPGADPAAITLSFEGVEKLRIDAQGDLLLDTRGGEVRQHKPLVYQEVDGVRREIAGAYLLNGHRRVRFQVGAYDADKPLIIDPVLSYSTYLGGSASDSGLSIAVDASGNAYVSGHTESANFPTASSLRPALGGTSDAFVTKLNAAGSALDYSTYLGGSGREVGSGISVDASGNAYVTGRTASADFPTASSIQPAFGGPSDTPSNGGFIVGGDAFVTKLNATGSALVYSTYLGGTLSDYGYGIAVDASGNAYVTGRTASFDFPTAGPIQADRRPGGDAFVTKLNAAGSALVYSTYLGGRGDDRGYGIAVDAAGNAYVTGYTQSTNFPTASPIQPAHGGSPFDAFVTKLNTAGSALVYSTYLGGSGEDIGESIAVDTSSNAYVTGYTFSTNFPTAGPLQPAFGGGISDAFVTKLNAAGSALAYSTYLGGSGRDGGLGISVDAGNAYVTGETFSTNFLTNSGIQGTSSGGSDAFVTKLNATGNGLVYSTYIGGGRNDLAQGIALDAFGNAYVAGSTTSTNFLTVSPFQPNNAGRGDVFIAKIGEQPPEPPTPILPANSVVNGASFRPATEPNSAIAPGAIVAIFGTDLASDIVLAQEVPLPTTLGDTSVTFNGIPAPLFFVSGTQINAQVPFELMTAAGSVTVQVKRGSETSTAQPIGMAAVSPGVFTLNQDGTGQGTILIANTPFLAAPTGVLEDSRPAQREEFISIFCTGLGLVQPEVPSGDVAPSTPPLAETLSPTLVNIAGLPALVTFSGLAPGFVGLYQVNVQVPAGVPSGVQEVEIIINGVPGNTITIAVQ